MPFPYTSYTDTSSSARSRLPRRKQPRAPILSPTHIPVVPVHTALGTAVPASDGIPTQGFADPRAAWQQASGLVRGTMSPFLAALARQQQQTVTGLHASAAEHGNALAAALTASAAPVAQAYHQAAVGSAATADAASNALQGEGATANRDLAAKLAQIGASPANTDALAQTYHGADAAGYTRDTQDVNAILSHGAESANYFGKLPGISRIETGRSLQAALNNASNQFTDQFTNLTKAGTEQGGNAFNAIVDQQQKVKDAQFSHDTAAYNQKNDAKAAATDAANLRYKTQAAAIQKQMDRDNKSYLTLKVASLAAGTQAEKMNFQKQMKVLELRNTNNQKGLDRISRESQAQLRADTSIGINNADNATTTSNKDKQIASADRRASLSAAAKVAAAKNKTSAAKAKSGNKPLSSSTIKAAQDRALVAITVSNPVVDPNTKVVSNKRTFSPVLVNRIKKSPPEKTNFIINQFLYKAVAPFVDPESPEGFRIRRSVMNQMDGQLLFVDSQGGRHHYRAPSGPQKKK